MTEFLRAAFETRDIATFMQLIFPPEWGSIAARIVESGATMSKEMVAWAPRWSPVPPTVRRGSNDPATWLKSCIYRAHDCIHQLWGLPVPFEVMDYRKSDQFYTYKRAQMCGEVAVLTLTEFVLARHLQTLVVDDENLPFVLLNRNALPMMDGPLRGKAPVQIAARLDGLLHKMQRPKWVRECRFSTAFVDDYVPMLESDRKAIDHNWDLMRETGWRPTGAPNVRYNSDLDGLELTTWLIEDFFHLMGTDPVVDEPLARFNRERRSHLVLPKGWNEP